LAHRIGPAPGAIHIRSDIVRKQLLKRDQFQTLGPGGYAPEVSARTYGEIRQRAEAVLKQGHAVTLDAVHGEETDREAARKLAAHVGCAFVGVWLEAPVQTRATRVSARGPDASDADAELVMRQEHADPGPIDWSRISSDRPTEEIVEEIVELSQRAHAPDTRTKGGRHVG
jgi:predicted kinase